MDADLVRAVVDEDGRLVDLVLSRELLAQQPWSVARAIVAAVNEAQDPIRARQDRLADPAALADVLDEVNVEAERRLAEFGTMVSDLMRQQRRAR